jgi:hypothetical protein
MIERRIDHARCKRVSEMSPEEMRQALLVSEKRVCRADAHSTSVNPDLGRRVRRERPERAERRLRLLCG